MRCGVSTPAAATEARQPRTRPKPLRAAAPRPYALDTYVFPTPEFANSSTVAHFEPVLVQGPSVAVREMELDLVRVRPPAPSSTAVARCSRHRPWSCRALRRSSWQKTSRPPGRNKRAASESQTVRSAQSDAPYSEERGRTTNPAAARPRRSPRAGKLDSGFGLEPPRGCRSCAGWDRRRPTGRRGTPAHEEKWRCRNRGSTTSRPLTSPSRFSSDSGSSNTPHVISSCAQARAAEASV